MFYTTEKLSPKQSLTNEGFLVCHDVPIARTGVQLYSSDEVPIDSPNGEVKVIRDEQSVFDPDTMASFEGKPVTINHPPDFVTPDNWKDYAVGTTQNVRRGTGLQDDLLIADLLITDKEAIDAIRNAGLREVSCGYEASYEQTDAGIGRQFEIVGNHVALVTRGRAGARCAIQDQQGAINMAKMSFKDRLMAAFKARDEESIERLAEEASSSENHVHVHLNSNGEPAATAKDEVEGMEQETEARDDVSARLDRIEAAIASLMESKATDSDEEEEKEEAKDSDEMEKEELEAKDSTEEGEEEEFTDTVIEAESTSPADTGKTYTGDAFRTTLARAEILAPSIALPTKDAAKGKSAIEAIQRKALSVAYATEAGKNRIDPFLNGRAIKSLTGDSLNAVFVGAAELTRMQNNANGIRAGVSTMDFGRTNTVAEINARNREFWANRK